MQIRTRQIEKPPSPFLQVFMREKVKETDYPDIFTTGLSAGHNVHINTRSVWENSKSVTTTVTVSASSGTPAVTISLVGLHIQAGSASDTTMMNLKSTTTTSISNHRTINTFEKSFTVSDLSKSSDLVISINVGATTDDIMHAANLGTNPSGWDVNLRSGETVRSDKIWIWEYWK